MFVELFEQRNEFNAAVTIFYVRKYMTRVQINGRKYRHRSVSNVFVISSHCGGFAWHWRQIWRHKTNGLNAWFFIKTYGVNGIRASIMNRSLSVKCNVSINHQYFVHLALKFRISLLQIIPNFVRLDIVLVQDSPHGAFARLRKPWKPCSFGVLPDMFSQSRDPEFDS